MDGQPKRQILVSVVMSVYNGAPFVEEAIKSILAQTFQNFEFIIIDDGSTDATKVILSQFRSDGRVRLFHQANIGLAESLNKGVSLSQGKYIARQDADDISFVDRIEKQFEYLERFNNIALLGTNIEVVNEKKSFLKYHTFPTDNDYIQQELMHRNCFAHGSVMIRKAVFEKVGGYRKELFLAEDYDLWLRIAERFEVGNISHILYQYRWGTQNISKQMRKLQRLYAEIVRQLAWQRRNKGYDILMNGGLLAFIDEFGHLLF